MKKQIVKKYNALIFKNPLLSEKLELVGFAVSSSETRLKKTIKQIGVLAFGSIYDLHPFVVGQEKFEQEVSKNEFLPFLEL